MFQLKKEVKVFFQKIIGFCVVCFIYKDFVLWVESFEANNAEEALQSFFYSHEMYNKFVEKKTRIT